MTDGTTGGGRRLRIGNVERNAAMKALDAHLEAGRLGVEEYGDRSAKAAGATTADELEELFSDLPEPHPALPGGDGAPAPMATAAPAARDEGTVEVATDDPATFDAIRDAVDDLGLALFSLTGRRHSLDELFVGSTA